MRDENHKWVTVTGWCAACWWHHVGEFHFTSRPIKHRQYMDNRHETEKGRTCRIKHVRIVMNEQELYLLTKYGGVVAE